MLEDENLNAVLTACINSKFGVVVGNVGDDGELKVKEIGETPEFYKKFYDENRVALLQYTNLREHFNTMVDNVLGADYYNMAMDVYEADRICCEDITAKTKSFISKLFHT